jgi:predicted Zn-dependent protease
LRLRCGGIEPEFKGFVNHCHNDNDCIKDSEDTADQDDIKNKKLTYCTGCARAYIYALKNGALRANR